MPAYYVAATSQIQPGQIARFVVGGRNLVLYTVNGRYYATDDRCTHSDEALSESGCLDGKHLVCYAHGGSFDPVTGEAIRAPANIPLTMYATWVDGDSVFVTLDQGQGGVANFALP